MQVDFWVRSTPNITTTDCNQNFPGPKSAAGLVVAAEYAFFFRRPNKEPFRFLAPGRLSV